MVEEKSCFISYAWDDDSRIKQFVQCLAACLRANGISPLVDMQCNSGTGSDIDAFIQNTMHINYIIVVISNQYLEKTKDCRTKVYLEWCNIQKRLGSNCAILPIVYDRDCKLPPEISHLCSVNVSLSGVKNLISQISGRDVSPQSIEKAFSNFDLRKYEFTHTTFTKAEVLQTAEEYAKTLLPEIAWKIRDATAEALSDGDIAVVDASEQSLVKPYILLESVCLEGYFQKTLRILVVATNGHIAPRFKYKLWSAYKGKDKEIILLDKHDLFFLRKPALKQETMCKKTEEADGGYHIIAYNYLSLPDFVDLNMQVLCPKDFYELLCEYKDYFTVKENLVEGDLYIFHLYIFSKELQEIELTNEENLPFTILKTNDAPYLIRLKKGFNDVYFRVKAQQSGTYTEQVLQFTNTKTGICKEVRMCSFQIEKFMTPQIVFKEQTDNFLKINDLIYASKSGCLISVLGNSGSGKSYLMRKLKEEQILSQQISSSQLLSIQFVGKEDRTNKNNELLSDLLFFLYSGLPFESNMEWLINSDLSHMILPPTLRKLIINLRKPDCHHALIPLIEEFENGSVDLIDRETYFDRKKIVFIDDIQKLSALSAKIFQCILLFFRKENLPVVFIMSGRKQELAYYENTFIEQSQKFEIGNMGFDDIKHSILKTNAIDKRILAASVLDRTFCNTVFYIRELVSRLCTQEYNTVSSFNQELMRNMLMLRHDNTYIMFLLGQLTEVEQTYMNIICSCKKFGLCICNSSYFNQEVLKKLEEKQYIVLRNEEILAGHDIFLESIQLNYDETLAKYLVSLYESEGNDQRKNQILSLLILCDFEERPRFMEESYQRLRMYFNTTEFSMILGLAKSMSQCMDSAGRNDLSIEQKAEITLIYANALNHCGDIARSYMNFAKVTAYKETGNLAVEALIFEANTEKINLDYWQLRTESIYRDLNELREETAACLWCGSYSILKAYLNTFNREMVTDLLLDKYVDAKSMLSKYLDECKKHKNEEYIGFAYMDYAKGIYNEDKTEALDLLKKAEQIFEKTGQIRRKLDCRCEIAYLNAILKHGDQESVDSLVAASDCLKENGLIAQYKKSIIKLAAVRLKNDLRYAARLMTDFNIFTLFDTEGLPPRNKLILSNLNIIQEKQTEKPTFCDISELFQLKIGESYLKIITHNQRVTVDSNTTVEFADRKRSYDENTFLIDTRIW